ncbi:hypothetical protein GIB67_032623 [Kingdonia uniflora]|uniref:SOUL heme-binding family protein n=1 Tax=Kingdonia uniflora TaxID=39325 RepID=A0A7J7P9I1_9MAGN|nr:hypothetical protein GIB67_032623 [Kingdonia uniflora]
MGMVLGKISVETPKYEVLQSNDDFEIRKYAPSVAAQCTYDPSLQGSNRDSGFTVLANYIGVLGKPHNTVPQKIAMTAPVVTSDDKERNMVTMQFLLPSMYTKAEDAPKPTDERVVITEEGERKYGVVKFSGVAKDEIVEDKAGKLKEKLESEGFKVIGKYVLARYNPPWTLPAFRTNEIFIPIQ